MSINLNGIITMLLIGNYPEIFTDDMLDKEFGFGRPERATIPAKRYNPRFNS
jgi:putative GTP pyrophosphokinase